MDSLCSRCFATYVASAADEVSAARQSWASEGEAVLQESESENCMLCVDVIVSVSSHLSDAPPKVLKEHCIPLMQPSMLML